MAAPRIPKRSQAFALLGFEASPRGIVRLMISLKRNWHIIYLIGLPVLFVALIVGRFAFLMSKIEVHNGSSCYDVPATARHIYASGSHASFAAEFEITEAELRDEAQRRGWLLQEIVTPVTVSEYVWHFESARREQEPQIAQGLFFNRGYHWIAFDRADGRAYWYYSGW